MTPECDYPKVKCLCVDDGTELVCAVQDTFEGRTYRRVKGKVCTGEVCSASINYDRLPESATAEGNRATSNYRVVEAVHANTVRAVLRRGGWSATYMKGRLLPGRWYRVIED